MFIITRKVVYYIKLNFKKQATKQFEFDTHFVKIRHACAPPDTHQCTSHRAVLLSVSLATFPTLLPLPQA